MKYFFFFLSCSVVSAALAILPLGMDPGWYLYLAGQVASGKVAFFEIYQKYYEVNFPLIILLNLPISSFARHLGLNVEPTAIGFYVATHLGLVLLQQKLLMQSPLFSHKVKATYFIVLINALWAAFFLLPLKQFDVGLWQREHLISLLLLIFIFAQTSSIGERRRLLISLTIAITITLLKPHYFAIVAAAELYRNLKMERKIAVSFLILGLPLMALVLVVAAFPNFPHVLQLALKYYDGYNVSLAELLFTKKIAFFGIAVPALYGAFRSKVSDQKTTDLLLLASLASIGIAIVQGKGWGYHYFPLICFSTYLLTITSWAVFEASTRRTLLMVLALVVSIVSFLSGLYQHVQASKNLSTQLLKQHVDSLSGISSYCFVSIYPISVARILNSRNLETCSRFHHLWFVPKNFRGASLSSIEDYRKFIAQNPALAELTDLYVNDLIGSAPDVLVFDSPKSFHVPFVAGAPPTGPNVFDAKKYLLSQEAFQAFFTWNYSLIGVINSNEVYLRKR